MLSYQNISLFWWATCSLDKRLLLGHNVDKQNCFQWAKVLDEGILSSNLCNLYLEHIRKARLDIDVGRGKFGGRNINNLRYSDNITLLSGDSKGLKQLLIKVLKEKVQKQDYRWTSRRQNVLSPLWLLTCGTPCLRRSGKLPHSWTFTMQNWTIQECFSVQEDDNDPDFFYPKV